MIRKGFIAAALALALLTACERENTRVVTTFVSETEVTWDMYWAFYSETMTEGGTLRQRISTSCNRLIRTPDTSAENHNPTGMK